MILAALLALLGAPALAAGQEEEAPDRWKVGLDFALTASSGNEEITVINSGLKVVHLIEEDYELDFSSGFRYGRSDGEEVARNLRGALKFDFKPQNDFSPFVFVSAERDRFKKIDLRANGGAGAKYRLWRGEKNEEATVSLATLYSYEDFAVARAPGVDPFAREAKLSWRAKLLKTLGSNTTLDHTTFYQPVWDSYGDYQLISETTARMLVNEWLAFSFGYTFEKDSTPIAGVEEDDQLVRAGVTLQW